jgi:hypothetical protein
MLLARNLRRGHRNGRIKCDLLSKQGAERRTSASMQDNSSSSFPISAGVFLGLGLGGFFDGIVFHQLPAMASYGKRLVPAQFDR